MSSIINKWHLFSSLNGWKAVQIRLDETLQSALQAMDDDIETNKTSYVETAETTFIHVLSIMNCEQNRRYGASDSEPREYLARMINEHLNTKHKVDIEIDRFGDALEVD